MVIKAPPTTLTIHEIYQRIISDNDLFIVDVRNQEDFATWHIETAQDIDMVNVPYFDFLEDETGSVEQVKTEKEVVVVCAKEGSSAFVADILHQHGFQANYLAGGIKEWGNHYVFRTVQETDNWQIYQVDRAARGCLSYVLISNGEAVIIDPLRHTDKYLDFLQQKGATLTYLLDTHAHADHISGAPDLAAATGAPYYLHPYDGIHPFDILPPKISYKMLADGDEFTVGDLKIRAIHAPGHTLGQVAFLVTAASGEQFFFSGDTIFLDSFGRPDLGGQGEKWAPIVYDTLFNIIKEAVSDEALLLPGHYAKASEANLNGLFAQTMKQMWQSNGALQYTERDEFISFVLSNLPTMPEQYIEIKRVNAGLVEPDEEAMSELELGKNICALSDAYDKK
ncbi:MAG: MBL fold metallo-hydrolase [Anaerolineae bacterium]|nr:MBL fold metallo-hydrolase [Anaerolineae bacterium]